MNKSGDSFDKKIFINYRNHISSVDVSREYSQEEEFMLSARYP
jgi:hypothetical protein